MTIGAWTISVRLARSGLLPYRAVAHAELVRPPGKPRRCSGPSTAELKPVHRARQASGRPAIKPLDHGPCSRSAGGLRFFVDARVHPKEAARFFEACFARLPTGVRNPCCRPDFGIQPFRHRHVGCRRRRRAALRRLQRRAGRPRVPTGLPDVSLLALRHLRVAAADEGARDFGRRDLIAHRDPK